MSKHERVSWLRMDIPERNEYDGSAISDRPFSAAGQLARAIARSPIEEIGALPAQMRAAVSGWSPEQFDTPYRPDGWTVRQLLHHVPESHMNSYIRCKLALTEDEPTIKPYDEDAWADLPDATTAPVDLSLDLLDTLHQRWVFLLRSMTAEQWSRTFRHLKWEWFDWT